MVFTHRDIRILYLRRSTSGHTIDSFIFIRITKASQDATPSSAAQREDRVGGFKIQKISYRSFLKRSDLDRTGMAEQTEGPYRDVSKHEVTSRYTKEILGPEQRHASA